MVHASIQSLNVGYDRADTFPPAFDGLLPEGVLLDQLLRDVSSTLLKAIERIRKEGILCQMPETPKALARLIDPVDSRDRVDIC